MLVIYFKCQHYQKAKTIYMKVPGSQADWIAPVANTRLVTRDRLLHLLSSRICPDCVKRCAGTRGRRVQVTRKMQGLALGAVLIQVGPASDGLLTHAKPEPQRLASFDKEGTCILVGSYWNMYRTS